MTVDLDPRSLQSCKTERSGWWVLTTSLITWSRSGKTASKREETKKEEENYLQRGIKARSFRQCFQLVEHDRVLDATLRNGILEIDIKRQNPEPKKHVTVQIRNG
ncbi:MAG: hypothetical protein EBV91_04535 [Actinobacteria bacterium]|nr:hypothetical protein [Actinomycetota bacterium]